MIIKSFTAETSAAALKKVREEMGGDALVLKTQRLDNGHLDQIVEVTACLEKPTVGQTSRIFSNDESLSEEKQVTERTSIEQLLAEHIPTEEKSHEEQLQKEPSQEEQPIEEKHVEGLRSTASADIIKLQTQMAEITSKLDTLSNNRQTSAVDFYPMQQYRDIYSKLKEADLTDNFINQLAFDVMAMQSAEQEDGSCLHKALVNRLSGMMLPSIEFKKGNKVVFVGPAGSGKSSAMAKLAVHLVTQQKMKTRLVTLDDVKPAALDEIHTYGDFLGIPVTEAERLTEENAEISDGVILIDTPAMPIDSDKLHELQQRITLLNPDYCFAVFPVVMRTADLIEIAKQMLVLQPSHLILTMLDLTRRYGSLIAAAETTDLKIAFTTNSPGGIGMVNSPDPDSITRTILNSEVNIEPIKTD